MPRRAPSRARRVAALALGSALALGASELLLQLAGRPSPRQVGWRASRTDVTNQLGYRGRPFERGEGRVVLLLGDSQVEATAHPPEAMPERLLERCLRERLGDPRLRVHSLGAGGYGQDQQLLALERYLAAGWRADVVALWLTPYNDVWNNLFPTHHPIDGAPKPTFWLESGRLRGPNEPDQVPGPRSRLLAAWRRASVQRNPDAAWASRLPPAYEPRATHEGPVELEWQRAWDAEEAGGRFRGEDVAAEKTSLALGFTPRSPRMAYALELTRALLHAIRARVEAAGGRLVVFHTDPIPGPETVTHRFQDRYWDTSGTQVRASLDELLHGLDAAHVLITVEDWKVGPEDAHLNGPANEQVMRDLAGMLFAR